MRLHKTTRTTETILSYAEHDRLPCPVDELAEQAATYRALLALEPIPAPPTPPTHRAAIAAAARDTIDAAGKAKTKGLDLTAWDHFVTATAEYEPAQVRHVASVEILNRALETTAEDLAGVLTEHDRVILAALQSYLDDMIAELRAIAPKVSNVNAVEALKAAQAGEDMLQAFQRFEQMTVEYSVMRSVQQIVAPVQARDIDSRGEFDLFRNVTELWKPNRTIGMMATPPWPTGDVSAFLLWCANHPEAELWLPTRAQRNEAHAAAYPDPAYRPRAV